MGAAIHRRKKPPEPVPSMGHRPGLLSGIHNLDPALTINGVTELPKLRYKGGDAAAGGWPAWGYGPTLALQAGTAPSYNQGSPLLGAYDDSVGLLAGGAYFKAASGGNVTTEDLVVEIVAKLTPTANKALVGTYDGAGHGWMVYGSTGSVLTLYAGSNSAGFAPLAESWLHAIAFIDHSANSIWYINSTAGTAAGTPAGSFDSATPFYIGGGWGGNVPGSIAYVSVWARDAWLDTHLQAAVAKARFLALTGGIPTIALGTATPTAFGSTSPAHQYKSSTSRLYYMGAGVPRFETPATGFTGMLNEGQCQNLALYSETIGSWSTSGLTTVSADGAIAPNGATVADGLVENDSVSTHFIAQAITLTATTYCLSVYAQAGARKWIGLSDDTLGSALASTALFDLEHGVVGALGANLLASGIQSVGGSWYRCWCTFTGTAASHQVRVYASNGNNLTIYAGDKVSVGVWLFGAQVALGSFPKEYVPTTTAAVTKAADSYILPAPGNVGAAQGAVRFRFCAPSGWTPSARRTLWSLNDGTANNRIDVYIHTDGTLCLESRKTGGTSGDISIAGSVLDGLVHEVLCCWDTGNAIVLYKDGTRGATGGDAPSIPTAPTQISLGQDAAAATNAAPIVVGDFKHFTRSIPSFALKGSGFRW